MNMRIVIYTTISALFWAQGLLIAQNSVYQPLITDEMLQMGDEQFLEAVKAVFKTELDWLLNGKIMGSAESLGKQDDEYKRTLRCLLSLKWVLMDDYEALTVDQAAPIKLTMAQFKDLQEYTKQHLSTAQARDAMFVFLLINDFGKIEEVGSQVREVLGITSHDHDAILAALLKHYKKFISFVPVFDKLSALYREKMIRTQAADLNFGQFLQAENLAANLIPARRLALSDLHFFLVHSIFDIAGAAGAGPKRGSIVLIRPAYESMNLARKALVEGISEGWEPLQIYNNYIKDQGNRLGVSLDLARHGALLPVSKENYALLRLGLMTRAGKADDIKLLSKILQSLEEGQKIVLLDELNKNGIYDSGILIYYGPALLLNSKNNFGEAGLEKALILMQKIFTKARASLASDKRTGVVTVNVQPLAIAINQKKVNLAELSPDDIVLNIKQQSPTEGLLEFSIK